MFTQFKTGTGIYCSYCTKCTYSFSVGFDPVTLITEQYIEPQQSGTTCPVRVICDKADCCDLSMQSWAVCKFAALTRQVGKGGILHSVVSQSIYLAP